MRLLVDMNLTPRWVELLKAAGLEAMHWSELGAPDAPGSEIMAYTKDNAFVVFTHDLDFAAILAATHGDAPSVIQVRADDPIPDALGEHVVRAIRQLTHEIEQGALEVA